MGYFFKILIKNLKKIKELIIQLNLKISKTFRGSKGDIFKLIYDKKF